MLLTFFFCCCAGVIKSLLKQVTTARTKNPGGRPGSEGYNKALGKKPSTMPRVFVPASDPTMAAKIKKKVKAAPKQAQVEDLDDVVAGDDDASINTGPVRINLASQMGGAGDGSQDTQDLFGDFGSDDDKPPSSSNLQSLGSRAKKPAPSPSLMRTQSPSTPRSFQRSASSNSLSSAGSNKSRASAASQSAVRSAADKGNTQPLVFICFARSHY